MTSMEAVRAVIKDEMLQVLATGAIALMLLGTQGVIDDYLTDILAGTGGVAGESTMMGAAQAVIGGLAAQTVTVLNDFASTSTELGKEASKSVFCNFLGVGYTLTNCSPLNAFRGSLTSSAFVVSAALADAYAQQFLLSLAQSFAFTFLIPVGLFLRCFKISRQAGGALIAVGFGFYTVFPTVIVATKNLLHGPSSACNNNGSCDINENPGNCPSDCISSLPRPDTCDPQESDAAKSLADFNKYATELTEEARAERLAYFALVDVLFMSVLNLIITLGFIREFAHMIGSDIDVSSLARIS